MNGFYGGKNTDALMRVYSGVKHTEISEEFILPDFLPDIKRIIRADAMPRIDGKYVSGGKVEYNGDMACRMLFTDEGNSLHAVTFNMSFSDYLEIPAVNDECIANLQPSPESLACRTVNPRRISIRMRLDTEVTVWCVCQFRPELIGDYASTTEVLNEEIGSLRLICAGENGLNASADIEADGALPQIGKVISCDVGMCFYECKPSEGRVLCRGEMPITVFYSSPTDDGEVYTVLFRKLPIAQVVDAEGATEALDCNARGAVESVKVNVSENGFGERRILELDISYRIYLNCVGNQAVTVTKDIYACDKNVEVLTETKSFYRFVRNYSSSFSVNYISEAGELGISDDQGIIGTFARPRVESVVLDRSAGRLKIDGSAETGALLNGEDGVAGIDYSVPFHIELEASGVPEDFIFSSDAVCMGAKARVDTGKVYTDLEIQLNVMILGVEDVEVLTKAKFTDLDDTKADAAKASMRLFYPAEGETLWSIGKSFGVSRDRIAEVNGITEYSSLPDVLIIPTK